ncbi:uncharacterized protein [Asterias amurensis]|uniref:uncharacterized protein isoform X2 n=1 Tax=Asterias amurensis TaxID=7602 RepID=UPI003AB173E4
MVSIVDLISTFAKSSPTLNTILGPSQGTSTTTALVDEDCLSTIDWLDIVFTAAVPIATGFGLLMLLAFLQDLRQACKSNHSWPSPPITIGANEAEKGQTYVIDVEYAGRYPWGSPLRWFAKCKSYAARTNLRLLRLRGTLGNSNWIDLALGEEPEQQILTTSCSIGKLAAVETKYPSSDGTIYFSRQMPHLSFGAYLRGLVNRACEIEIKNIHVLDTKTQDQFISNCSTSNGGISSSEQGITTLLPLLPFTAKPAPRVNHFAYFIKNAFMLTSTFIPWRQGNFTGVRHITCIFACITSTMLAVQGVSMPLLEPPLGDLIVTHFTGYGVTFQVVVKALGVGLLVYPFVLLVELLFQCLPTVMSSHKKSTGKQQGSASSHNIIPQYQPETESQTDDVSIPSLPSSDILYGESSSQDTIQREISPCVDGDIVNKNNNKNDVTIVEIDPADDLPNGMQICCSDSVSVSTATPSMSSSLDTSSCVTIINIEDDDVKTDQLVMDADSKSQSDLVQTKTHRDHGHCAPVIALACHILLVGLSMLSLLASMMFIHGLCWDAFWDWVVTSIIAILTQIVVLDFIKAITMTVVRARTNK